jgi:hypothetical protein
MTTTTTTLRNAGLEEMTAILQQQQARKFDLVAPAGRLRVKHGQLALAGLDPLIEADGVTDPNGTYTPTEVFDEGVAARLEIPRAYLRRLREQRPDLYDANVNGWLAGRKPLMRYPSDLHGDGEAVVLREGTAPDPRSFLVRLFRGEQTGAGIARALLSNRYARLDNLDGLMAMLAGITEAGIEPGTLTFDRCDQPATRGEDHATDRRVRRRACRDAHHDHGGRTGSRRRGRGGRRAFPPGVPGPRGYRRSAAAAVSRVGRAGGRAGHDG